MSGRRLEEILDLSMFTQKRVCIEEILPQNVTFLIIDISSIMGLSIFAFNETAECYNRIAFHHGRKINVKSIYDGEYLQSDIIDDVWTAANVYKVDDECQFSVYRANSCRKADWYNYDVVIRVEPLESGTSADIDGRVVAFDREKRYFELKYKVLKDKTVYYN